MVASIEKFMTTHRGNSFTALPAQLALAKLKKARKSGKALIPVSPVATTDASTESPSSGGSSGSRKRTIISMLYGRFIDEYLETYKSLSGQSAARNRLVKEIMATAGTRAALESADIAAVAVKKRLANTLAKTNKKQRAAFDLDPEEPALAGDAL